MQGWFVWTSCALAVVVFTGCASSRPIADPARWEKDIQAFEAMDRERPPAEAPTLFVGSSSIRMWNGLAADFPEQRIIQRGFGGSHMSDLLAYADRIVLPYRPRVVVVYEGDNDLAAGKSPKVVFQDSKAFAEHVHAALPDVHVAFLAIKPSIDRLHLSDEAAEANLRIAEFCESRSWLSYVDVYWPLLDAAGQPREELFLEDGLHLNAEGYALWREIIEQHLEEVGF